jgi:hypothetical protein
MTANREIAKKPMKSRFAENKGRLLIVGAYKMRKASKAGKTYRPATYSLRTEDVAQLKEAARGKGLSSSAALRLAIHEFAQRERRRIQAEAV